MCWTVEKNSIRHEQEIMKIENENGEKYATE